jgi:endonuclease I
MRVAMCAEQLRDPDQPGTADVAAGRRAAGAIGRIVVAGEYRGPGFLVAPSVLLTDPAVLSTVEDAARAVVELGDPPAAFDLRPGTLFAADAAGGYTLVAVAARSGDGAPLAAVDVLTAAASAPQTLAEPDDDAHELHAALAAVREGQERPYYDTDADAAARTAYYATVDRSADPDALRASLAALVTSTHANRPKYQPSQQLYPWVDLHPDRLLRSIYSGATFTAEELVRADVRVEAARRRRWRVLLAESTTTFAAQAAAVEAELLFNCEHVVPQSWFDKAEPMRGDLHHLFACEPKCNSFRGNTPFFDFAGTEGVHEACGRSDTAGFEPVAGKGPAARATLYFLLRYPGEIGDEARELSADRLEMLLSWHEQDPVSDYELHRNAAIAEIQGNRNPFVDEPALARLVDLRAAWGVTVPTP